MHYYDRIADLYSKLYGDEQKAKMEALIKHLEINKEDVVLDVGCGSGILFNFLGIKTDSIIALDISSNLLKKAKNASKRMMNVHLLRADAEFMPFRDEVFDLTFSITLIQNLPDPIKFLKELLRISKKDSKGVITFLKHEFSPEKLNQIMKMSNFKYFLIQTDDEIKDHILLYHKKN